MPDVPLMPDQTTIYTSSIPAPGYKVQNDKRDWSWEASERAPFGESLFW